MVVVLKRWAEKGEEGGEEDEEGGWLHREELEVLSEMELKLKLNFVCAACACLSSMVVVYRP